MNYSYSKVYKSQKNNQESNESTEKKIKLSKHELLLSKQQELFDELIKYAVSNIKKDTLVKLKQIISSMLDEYDFSFWDAVTVIENKRYKTYYVEIQCETCLSLTKVSTEQLTCLEKEYAIEYLIVALSELHLCDIRLFYSIFKKLFNVKKRILLFEFYDLAYLFASYNGDKYTKSYLLTQSYYKDIDEQVKEYFNASKEDVQYILLKIQDKLEYVDEALLNKIDIVLSQDAFDEAFVHLAKALCITKFVYAIKNKNEITYTRGLKL